MSIVTTNDQARQNLATNLQRILAERGWSQRHLAAVTGEPFMTINQIVRGKNLPKVGSVARIAEALAVSIDRLVGPPPEMPTEDLSRAS